MLSLSLFLVLKLTIIGLSVFLLLQWFVFPPGCSELSDPAVASYFAVDEAAGSVQLLLLLLAHRVRR